MSVKLFLGSSAVALAMSATSGFAASLHFEGISVAWSNAVGGVVTSNSSTGVQPGAGGSATITWDADNEGDLSDDSGYVFQAAGDPAPNPSTDVDVSFLLGNFTHNNFSVPLGSGIDSVNLDITGDIILDGINQGTSTFSFFFDHNETVNNASPCPAGDNVGSCADIVTVSALSTTDTFFVGTTEYTMNVEGFLQGGVPVSSFISPEGASNSAGLYAIFTSDIPSEVPLPAAGVLMLAGLGGLGAMRRRKKSA